MRSVTETPAYRKQSLYDVLAMVKQLRVPTYLLKLPFTDLRQRELPYITNKLNNRDLSDEEQNNSSYQERCNLLNNNPVLVA